jgi:ferredoxin
MLTNYGYRDGSGEYFITIDTEKCTGCQKCVAICPAQLFEVVADPFDPLAEREIAVIREEHRKKLKYSCVPCKPSGERLPLPCVQACQPQAISHSW